MAVDRIRIRLKAYDHAALDRSVDEIVQTVKRATRIAGPVPRRLRAASTVCVRLTLIRRRANSSKRASTSV